MCCRIANSWLGLLEPVSIVYTEKYSPPPLDSRFIDLRIETLERTPNLSIRFETLAGPNR